MKRRSRHTLVPLSKRGLTLIELSVMMALFMVGMLAFAKAVKDSIDLGDTSHESALAREAAQGILENMRGVPFEEVWVRYNSDTADDPAGLIDSPGSTFAVTGLNVRKGDDDGFVGQILLPEKVDAGGAQLREDLANPDIGMPRDLNLDGLVDGFDHAGDYLLLPVSISIEWRGRTGNRKFKVHTILSNR